MKMMKAQSSKLKAQENFKAQIPAGARGALVVEALCFELPLSFDSLSFELPANRHGGAL